MIGSKAVFSWNIDFFVKKNIYMHAEKSDGIKKKSETPENLCIEDALGGLLAKNWLTNNLFHVFYSMLFL